MNNIFSHIYKKGVSKNKINVPQLKGIDQKRKQPKQFFKKLILDNPNFKNSKINILKCTIEYQNWQVWKFVK